MRSWTRRCRTLRKIVDAERTRSYECTFVKVVFLPPAAKRRPSRKCIRRNEFAPHLRSYAECGTGASSYASILGSSFFTSETSLRFFYPREAGKARGRSVALLLPPCVKRSKEKVRGDLYERFENYCSRKPFCLNGPSFRLACFGVGSRWSGGNFAGFRPGPWVAGRRRAFSLRSRA